MTTPIASAQQITREHVRRVDPLPPPTASIKRKPKIPPVPRAPHLPLLRRPKKWAKTINAESIDAARRVPCCAKDHRATFSTGQVLDARILLCRLSEQEVLVHVAAMVKCMLLPDGCGVTFLVQGLPVCRVAFQWYYGIADRKLRHAISLARGNRNASPYFRLTTLIVVDGVTAVAHVGFGDRATPKRDWLVAYLYHFLSENCDTHQSGNLLAPWKSDSSGLC